jgi:polar amino acid transport system substrate-binding protein
MNARTVAGCALTVGALLFTSACKDGAEGGQNESSGGPAATESRSPASATKTPTAVPSPAGTMAKMPAGTDPGLRTEGRLTVCRGAAQTPFLTSSEEVPSANGATVGKVKGFDVEMLSLIGQRINAVPQFNGNVPVDKVYNGEALKQKWCDVIGGISTDSKAAFPQMSFSVPYFTRKSAILVQGDARYASLDDLVGKRVAARTTTPDFPDEIDAYNDKHSKKINVQRVEHDELLIGMLTGGHVDAVVLGNGQAKYFAALRKESDLHVTAEFGKSYQAMFAVRKGNSALLKQIDAALADAGRNGLYAAAYRTWFSEEPKSVPTAG